MNFRTIKFSAIIKILLSRPMAFFLVLFSVSSVFSQQKFTTVISSKEVGRTDYVQIEFVVENAKQIEHLTAPSFPDFRVVEGPMQSSGMTIVNGNMSQYKGVSFILQPVKTGKFTIQGATAEIDGKQMHSNSVNIEVSANSSGNSANINPMMLPPSGASEPEPDDKEYILKPGENIVDKTKKNLFVKVQVDKNTCYVGEPIVATYKLYSRLRSESRVTKHPSLNGFSVYDMIDPNNDAASVETVNGKPFTVHVIRKAQLIPLQPGSVDLDAVEVDNTIHFLKSNGKRRQSNSILQDLLDQFSQDEGGDEVEQQIALSSKPVTINVKPLPETNKPADYNGAVGHFEIDAMLENKNISAQDAATLKVTVKGSGNLPVIDAPQVKWPAGLDVYNNAAKENIDKTIAPMKGTKTFEYVFTPKAAGSYTIPPIEFSYFDPASDTYKNLQTQPLQFNVSAAKKQSPSSLLNNLLPSKTNQGFFKDVSEFIIAHLEWIFAALILCTVVFYLVRHNAKTLKREEEQKQKAIEAERLKKEIEVSIAPASEIIDPLARTKRMFAKEDYKSFYSELNHALWESLVLKFNLPASELNKQNISLQLKAKGWGDEEIESLQYIFNQCEMSLYTPDYNASDMQNLLIKSEHIIKYINEV